jgi:putative colanic acid biosynthesis UDP-glucose lipid carrier transferase
MNFVNRDLTVDVTSEVDSRSVVPSLNAERKWPIRYEAIELFAICADIATILLASMLSVLIYRIDSNLTAANFGKAVGSAIIVSALFVSLVRTNGNYRPTELLVLRHQIRAACVAWIFVFLLLAAAVGALNIGHELPRGAGIVFALLGLVLLIAQRTAVKALLMRAVTGKRFAGGSVVLISDQPQSSNGGLAETLTQLGFSISAQFNLPPPGSGCRKRLSARVIEHIRGSDIEQVMVEADPNRWAELRAFVADLRVLPFPVVFVPVGAVAEMLRRPTRHLGSAVCVELHRRPLTVAERATKRCLDLIGAGLALITLSPLLAAVALAIKFDSRGPIFFRQQRCGFNGRSFAVYKFRTMFVLEDGPSIIQARSADSRVTPIGKWLRRTSIDELPQLFNVLNGSMSLVGPRPHAVAHDSQFDKTARNYAFRRRVKPGLTGWAQIHGCRGPTPTAASIERRVEYDLWYIDNWSLRLDFGILLQTPIEVLRGRNAY